MKNTNWFSKTKSGKEIKWFLKKILKLEIKKDLIGNYFEKDVVKKIWLVLKRCDWEDVIWKHFKKIWFWKLKTWLTRKDMIQTLNLSQQKSQHTWIVKSNH